jgi:superfamily II DNA or RNA helicase
LLPPPSPLRLTYVLQGIPRVGRTLVLPQLRDAEAVTLTEAEIRSMRRGLHALDQAIVQELCAGAQFGHLADPALARILPLLAQRQTRVDGERLRLGDDLLQPRVVVRSLQSVQDEPCLSAAVKAESRLCLELELHYPDGEVLHLQQGRLLAGSQAYFLRGAWAIPIQSPNPWRLADWARQPLMALADHQLTPAGRDALVANLKATGVPEADLEALAVHRGPPEKIILRLLPPGDVDPSDHTPRVRGIVEVVYAGVAIRLDAQRQDLPYLQPVEEGRTIEDPAALTERDLMAEDEIRQQLKLAGFRYDRSAGEYIVEDEAALAVADPARRMFPPSWQVERDGLALQFRHDLTLHTQIKMVQERGLLDVQISVKASQPEEIGDAIDPDAQAVQALVDMRELLAWLRSGKRYVRLADGSYAAPSARFRQGLRILGDMGADNERALVSPLCIGLLRAIGDHAALEAADAATRAWFEELAQNRSPPEVAPPPGLRAVLRDYQRRGVDWLMMLHRHRLTGILADDMGLGKTLQTLALLLLVRETEGRKPSLVVAPTSVVGVWRDEAAHFAPDLKLALWYGPPEVRRALDPSAADLIVTSYGILRRDAERFANIEFRYVILDEAQSAKNAASHNAAAIRQLKSERRLALSGTPLENRPEELWSIFDFLAPGFLGSLRQFRRSYAVPISRGENEPLELLRLRLQPLILRRLKSEVATELPDKVEQVLRCEMGPAQRALYEHIAGELRDSIRQKIARVGIDHARLDILAALTRLRQICCDPSLLPVPVGTRLPPSAKLKMFEELLREALGAGRKVVVFSQFVTMQRKMIEVIERLGVKPLWLHGGSSGRDKIVARFQSEDGPPVIVVSLRAGGTGVTLTRADTVVHYDPWWNPAVERQATDRAHRLGQKKTVYIYKLICSRSIEDRVLQLAGQKEALAGRLLGSEGGAAAKKISQEEVLALLSADPLNLSGDAQALSAAVGNSRPLS